MKHKLHTVQKSGFSLIEMLVVVIVFSILAYLVTQSTLQSFKGVRKTDAQSKVRDSLNFATSIVERNLRNAKTITYPSQLQCNGNSVDHIDYLDINDKFGSFTCDNTNGYLASGSANLRLTGQGVVLTACSFTCTKSTSPQNPPTIDLQLIGRDTTSDTTSQSLTAVSSKIVPRTY